jgi:hypothetical protein
MPLTLGEASKQSGFAKSSLSKAISRGRLAAVRSANGSFAIDEAELQRFVEANAPPVRLEALAAGTAVDDLVAARVRAEVAEKMLVLLQAQLAEMTAQRDRWERRFDQLKLPPANGGERGPKGTAVPIVKGTAEQAKPWWHRFRFRA